MSTTTISSSKPICVTGANGFVAAHIVKQLLEKNYTVHGTVRNLKDTKKYDHLTKLPNAAQNLKLFEASLTKDGDFDAAVAGCDVVMHTASPYALDVKDAQKDLVDPAIKGTLTVLQSCTKQNVKRVVLTSSVAAITDEPDNNKVYTETDWNTASTLDRNPYYYSKVVAEKAAWDYKEKNPSLELIVINPCVVIGPSLSSDLNQSNKIIAGMMSSEFPGIIHLGWAFVDVRDVAKAHVLAAESTTLDVSKPQRFICANTSKNMKEVVEIIGKKFPELKAKLPAYDLQCGVGDFLVKFSTIFAPKGTATYLRTNLGKYVYTDNSKIKKDLGMQFIDIEQSMQDTINDLITWGHVKK